MHLALRVTISRACHYTHYKLRFRFFSPYVGVTLHGDSGNIERALFFDFFLRVMFGKYSFTLREVERLGIIVVVIKTMEPIS